MVITVIVPISCWPLKRFSDMQKTAAKKKCILLILFGSSFFFGLANGNESQISKSAHDIEIIDDAGNSLFLDKPATRIISLAPHISEILFYIEQGEKIVGLDIKSDFPEAAKKITKVSDANQLNLEAIIALQPDLIIAWQSGNNPKQLAKLQALGFPIYFSEPKTLEDIARNISHFGILTGNSLLAETKASLFKQRLSEVKNNKHSPTKVKVFYQVWEQPLYTINGEHIISEVIDFCGGENIFHELKTIAPQVNMESIILRNPDLIISGADKKDSLKMWQQWPTISAVKNNQFLAIDSDHIVRAGPRIVSGVEIICEKITQIQNSN